jgi:hypothetical protein
LVPPPKKWVSLAEAPEPSDPALIGNGIVASEGFTLIFAKQGTGKGFVCAEIASQLLQEGHRVLLLDFEKRYSQWYPRAFNLIPSKFHDSFFFFESEHITGSIKELVPDIRDAVFETGATVLIVDSYAWSVPGVAGKTTDPMREEAVAFGRALTDIGLPAVVTAHVTKAKGTKVDPYGSVYLPAAAALTWNLEANVDTTVGLEVSLTYRKSNAYEKQEPIKLLFEFNDEGHPVECKWLGASLQLVDKIWGICQEADCTYTQIFEKLKERYPQDTFERERVKAMCAKYSNINYAYRRLERLPKKGTINEPQVYRALKAFKRGG